MFQMKYLHDMYSIWVDKKVRINLNDVRLDECNKYLDGFVWKNLMSLGYDFRTA